MVCREVLTGSLKKASAVTTHCHHPLHFSTLLGAPLNDRNLPVQLAVDRKRGGRLDGQQPALDRARWHLRPPSRRRSGTRREVRAVIPHLRSRDIMISAVRFTDAELVNAYIPSDSALYIVVYCVPSYNPFPLYCSVSSTLIAHAGQCS